MPCSSPPSVHHLHFLHAVPANDIDCLCGSDAVPAARANIFPCAAPLRRCRCCRVSCSAAARLAACAGRWCVSTAAIHADFRPALPDDVIYQLLARLRDSPAVCWVMLYHQPPPLRFVAEMLVVVGVPPAAILHTVRQIVEVYRLVHHRGYYVLDRPFQRLRSDVQFVPPFISSAFPDLRHGNVSVGSRCALDGDNWFFQLPAKPVVIQCAENLLEVSCRSACLDCLFQLVHLLFCSCRR